MRNRSCAILVTILFFPFLLFGQANHNIISELYSYVDNADRAAIASQRTFYLEKFLKDNFNYRETWRYSENSGNVFYFQIDYILDSTEFTEVYYVNRGNLVCSEEYEKVNYSFMEDELKYGGIYYFKSADPKQVVTLGKKDIKYRTINPEIMVLTRFHKRYSELKRHIPMLP